jgi:hypothetical protein
VRIVVLGAVAIATIGVFSTWTTAGPVTLNGIEGPNNGWLVLIVGAFAIGWSRSLARGSWIGVAGVLGAAVVMGWTAVENWLDGREVVGAAAGFGLVLVTVASAALVCAATVAALALVRRSNHASVDA